MIRVKCQKNITESLMHFLSVAEVWLIRISFSRDSDRVRVIVASPALHFLKLYLLKITLYLHNVKDSGPKADVYFANFLCLLLL